MAPKSRSNYNKTSVLTHTMSQFIPGKRTPSPTINGYMNTSSPSPLICNRISTTPCSLLCHGSASIKKFIMYRPLHDLMKFVRSRIERNHGGITNTELYSISNIGTKTMIEAFIHNICISLHYIAYSDISLEEKIVYFEELQHILGRTALCLSGGGALGFYHIGVVLELARNNLLPKIITGASAGSFIAAVTCCKLDHELSDMQQFKMKLYNDEHHRTWFEMISVRLKRFWQKRCFLDGRVPRQYTHNIIGDITFLEAFHKTGRVLNIAVSSTDANVMPRLLNYLTAPNVVIWSAVCASCAVPLFYEPQQLFVKSPNTNKIEAFHFDDEDHTFSDGSLTQDLPMDRIRTLFNVDNFIVSQVNPHMVPFLFHSIIRPIPLFEKVFKFLGKEFHLYLSTLLVCIGGIRIVNDLLVQRWSGDVTIVPNIPIHHYINVMKNPTQSYLQRVSKAGTKATFKHISRLQVLCATEFTIDKCLSELKSQYTLKTRN